MQKRGLEVFLVAEIKTPHRNLHHQGPSWFISVT